MKSTDQDPAELSAELERLNTLVRERRKQLAFLERCPNKTCQCRVVWREVVEKNLASQVGKIRKKIRSPKAKGKAARKK